MSLLSYITEKNIACVKDTEECERYIEALKADLSQIEKKLLLCIVDEKDLLIEKAALENFERGFCMGVQLTSDIFMKNFAPAWDLPEPPCV
ncbi:MAG: DUF6809 family protein [Christensenellales bacterium]